MDLSNQDRPTQRKKGRGRKLTPEEFFEEVIHPFNQHLTWEVWVSMPEPDRQKISAQAEAKQRKAYQRKYYQLHKEKAKEYQRQYNLTHKKKVRLSGRRGTEKPARLKRQETFNESDVMSSVVGQTEKVIERMLEQ